MSLKQIKMAIGDTYTHFGFTYDPDKLMREHKTTIFKRLYDFKPEMKAYYQKILESSGLTEEKVQKFLEAKKSKKEKESVKKEGVKVARSSLGRARGESSNSKIANLLALKESEEKRAKQLAEDKKETEKMKTLEKEAYIKSFAKVTKNELENKKEYLTEKLSKLEDVYDVKKKSELLKDKEIVKLGRDISLLIGKMQTRRQERAEFKDPNGKKAKQLDNEMANLSSKIDEKRNERDQYQEKFNKEIEEKYDKPMKEEKKKLDDELAATEKKIKKLEKIGDEDVAVIKFMLKEVGIKPEEFEGNFSAIKDAVETKRNADVAKESIAVQADLETIRNVEDSKSVGEVEYTIPTKIYNEDEIKQNVAEFIDEGRMKQSKLPPSMEFSKFVDKIKDYDVPAAPPVYDESKIKKNLLTLLDEVDFARSKLKPVVQFEQDRTSRSVIQNAVEQFKKPLEDKIKKQKERELQDAMEFEYDNLRQQIENRRSRIDPEELDEDEQKFLYPSTPAPPAPPIPVTDYEEDETARNDPDEKQFEVGSGIGGYTWWGGKMQPKKGGMYMKRAGFISPELHYEICNQFGGYIPEESVGRVVIQPYFSRGIRNIVAAGGSILDVAKGIKKMVQIIKK